jgi:CRP/FNR family transcriptional regulator, anaerobic regulatory protein
MPLLSYISSIISVSPKLEAEINSVSKKITAPKGKAILEIDERCNHLYFIESGLVRGYYFDEDKEITNWFAQEGEFATCFYSFIAKENAFENIQAIEDVSLIQLSYTDLQNIYKRFPETERIGRIITENYYIKLEERLLSIQFKTAKERYQNLLEKNPKLLLRASLGQIASYLGITQETLSRIRAEG